MNTAQSPLEIQILLHYFYSPHDHEQVNNPNMVKLFQKFLDAGLLYENELNQQPKYKGNREALEVYIRALESVPFPVAKLKYVIEP